MRRAFGLSVPQKTALPYTKVRQGDLWVDDPDSRFYNQYVAVGAVNPGGWRSAESLADEDMAYQYAIVVEYNTDPIVRGKGSAIFLNRSNRHASSGCIGVPEKYTKKFFKFVRSGDKIIIKKADE